MYAKLQKAEMEGEAGVHGASTDEVMESVLQVSWCGRSGRPLVRAQAGTAGAGLRLGPDGPLWAFHNK